MNKIQQAIYKIPLCLVIFLSTTGTGIAQTEPQPNKYGLLVIADTSLLRKAVQQNPAKALCNLKKEVPGIVLDLRYGTTRNFMQRRLYTHATTTYLRREAAEALAAVQAALKPSGLGIKIFDAYRPYRITEKMWELVQDDRYAADPRKGSGHNRGTAVDLTLVQLSTGRELDMGTGFDNFSDTAHHSFTALPANVLQNRLLLKNLMEKNGFRALDTEWWHYSLQNAAAYELLDIPFEQLNAMQQQQALRRSRKAKTIAPPGVHAPPASSGRPAQRL